MIDIQDLSGTWNLRGTDVDLPAEVPGCVHTDLLAAGRIPDPFFGDNEHAVAWVGRQDWTYQRDLTWDGPAHDRIDLVFDGLDTVARVELGGRVLGETRNMHRSYRFDVTSQLGTAAADRDPADATAGASLPLSVYLTSAYTEAARVEALVGPKPNCYPEPFPFVRKMACSFGWDWGPTLVTAGIWRPVRLEGWSTARLATVRPLATYRDGGGDLDLTVDVERTRDRALRAQVLLDGRELTVVDVPADQTSLRARIPVDGIAAWSPRGYGPPALYELTVVLLDGDQELDRWRRHTGFRTVTIDRGADDAGTRFVIEVNGEPVLAKGVNWIPDDIFPSRMTRARYEKRLREAVAAGVNLVRVWGGGIYEDRAFYELCDELGLLVWQDFLFACACYPEDEPIFSEVVAEARENVTRLSPHPSLITWNGNNENLWLHDAMNWAAEPGGGESWGEKYYLQTLPAIVAELDPTRPYQAGSPWSGSWEHAPNSPDHQTFHSWEVWNREDYGNYRDSAPRFVSEFGWQAPPAWTTLRDAVSDDPMLPDSPGVLHHQKAEDGNGKLARGLEPHFPAPASTEAWHYLTQLNQVRAIRTGVEHWRSHWPHTAGTILWQLNDLWPVTSWAAIDGAGRYKPLYFALRDVHADRALTIQPRDGRLVVAVLNDHPEPWTGSLSVESRDSSGTLLHIGAEEVEVAPRSVTLVPINGGDVLVATLDGRRALWFAADHHLGDPDLTVTASSVPGGLDVHVNAAGLARDILLQADRIHPDAVTDQGFVTLLPGESTTLHVRAPIDLDPRSVKDPWVLTDLASVLRENRPS
ncbi:glycoside hydrolase family 2 protein [Actinoplanes utahensis]|uniref:beta-mannosidase n=1 Tax=Actinoplanes utahensis TaxID=1869 RepID=A0A0A6UMR1_ACTUT|nr:glycoside hydrolase family 2 protein [Actinoplanes utahensis]KHD75614.1 beta-mannosidase [Actinoplanes utahensis]GIF27137.1 beta-mannosidase [Actinoplanes utahensis]